MNTEQIKKICKTCGAKCCKYFSAPTVTKTEKERLLKFGVKDKFYSSGKYFDYKTKTDVCPFLKNNCCSVHHIEPLLCKPWPVWPVIVGEKKKYIILDCPLTKHLTKSDIEKLKRYARAYPKFFTTWGITDLSKKAKKRLDEFGWSKKIKELGIKDFR